MRQLLVSLIKPFAEMCHKAAVSVSPNAAMVVYVGVLVGLIVWVITLKGERKRPDGTLYSFLADLRTWAVIILVIQIALLMLQFLPLEMATAAN